MLVKNRKNRKKYPLLNIPAGFAPPLRKISLNGEKCTCLGFSSPNFSGFFPFFPDFFLIQAIFQLLGRKKPKFSALRTNLGHNYPKFAPARAKKLGKKTGFLDCRGGEKTGFVARILTSEKNR